MKPHYLSYSATALAADEAFIGWVLDGVEDAAWSHWLEQHPEAKSRILAARSLVESLHRQTPFVPDTRQLDTLWDRIEQSAMTAGHTARIRPLWIRMWPVAAAAAVALLVWFAMPFGTRQVNTGLADQQEVRLPEESVVLLNAGSHLTFAKRGFEKDRTLTLEGEGFFQVHPGSRFTVNTPYGSVTVLGTSFNVFARNGRLEVTCYTGKVRVTAASSREGILTPGQRILSEGDTFAQQAVAEAAAKPEWTDGRFRFEDQPLRDVIAELERQFDVRVQFSQEIGDLRYTGLFERGDLDEALRLVTWPLHITYTREQETIRLMK